MTMAETDGLYRQLRTRIPSENVDGWSKGKMFRCDSRRVGLGPWGHGEAEFVNIVTAISRLMDRCRRSLCVFEIWW